MRCNLIRVKHNLIPAVMRGGGLCCCELNANICIQTSGPAKDQCKLQPNPAKDTEYILFRVRVQIIVTSIFLVCVFKVVL